MEPMERNSKSMEKSTSSRKEGGQIGGEIEEEFINHALRVATH